METEVPAGVYVMQPKPNGAPYDDAETERRRDDALEPWIVKVRRGRFSPKDARKPPIPVHPEPSPGTPAVGLQQPKPFPGDPDQAVDFRGTVSEGE